MKFENLRLQNFRNFEEIDLGLSPSVNIFIGKNGQGKTNLLESLYFVTHGESFRPGQLDTFVRSDLKNSQMQKSFIRGKVSHRRLESQLEVQFVGGQKKHLVDQKRSRGSEVSRTFPTVLFSPDSLSSIKQGPDHRRALIDDFLMNHSPSNKQVLSQFRKVLRSRNKLLKTFQKGEMSLSEFEKMLESLNPSFFQRSTELSFLRVNALKQLLPKMREALKYIMDEKDLEIDLDYIISDESALDWDFANFTRQLLERSNALKLAERSTGSSLVGPHKHDIRILFNKKDSRYYCSQGQQRALILSFKMAQIVYHYEVYQNYPVLLLDDVMSELDMEKRKRLVEFLSQINAQILITTTEFDFPEGFNKEQLKIFEIESGKIKPSSFV